MKKFKGKMIDSEISILEWAIVFGILIFVMLVTNYQDLDTLTTWSLNLLDVISEGNIRNFYDYTALNLYEINHVMHGGEIAGIIPWAVWNIPIWVLRRFFDVNILDSALCILWSQCFLILVLLITAYYTYKLGMMMTGSKNKSKLAAFLTISSIYAITGTAYAGQNDILWVCLSVMAIYYLLNGKNSYFYILSACSIAIKPFFLFCYIAIILLFEKNIYKIVYKVFFSITGILFFKLLFLNAPMYQESLSSGTSMQIAENLFAAGIPMGAGAASIFTLNLIIIYLICYVWKKENAGHYELFYICSIIYLNLLLFSSFEYYRFIILIPFIYLVMIKREGTFLVHMVWEILFNIILMIYNLIFSKSFFGTWYVNPKIIGISEGTERPYTTILAWIKTMEIGAMIIPFVNAAFLAGALFYLIYNFPNQTILKFPKYDFCPKWLVALRYFESVILIVFVYIYLLIWINL